MSRRPGDLGAGLRGGMSSAVHLVTVQDADGQRRQAVLRRCVRPEDEPGIAGQEARALRFARSLGVPAPRLLAVDPDGTWPTRLSAAGVAGAGFPPAHPRRKTSHCGGQAVHQAGKPLRPSASSTAMTWQAGRLAALRLRGLAADILQH
jgi:hypothetical protein